MTTVEIIIIAVFGALAVVAAIVFLLMLAERLEYIEAFRDDGAKQSGTSNAALRAGLDFQSWFRTFKPPFECGETAYAEAAWNAALSAAEKMIPLIAGTGGAMLPMDYAAIVRQLKSNAGTTHSHITQTGDGGGNSSIIAYGGQGGTGPLLTVNGSAREVFTPRTITAGTGAPRKQEGPPLNTEYLYAAGIRYKSADKIALKFVSQMGKLGAQLDRTHEQFIRHVQKTCAHNWRFWKGHHGSSKGDQYKTCRECDLTIED